MTRVKQKLRSIMHIILTIAVGVGLFSNLCIVTYADSNDRQRAMIQYFENQGATGITDNITEADLRLFGIFMSNFYEPFSTNLLQGSVDSTSQTYEEKVKTVCAYLMGYSDYTDMSSQNQEIASEFATKMLANIKNNKKALYLATDTEIDITTINQCTLRTWLEQTQNVQLVDENGNVFFKYEPQSTGNSRYCDVATIVALAAGGDSYATYVDQIEEADNDIAYALYITPFGDIIDGSGLVIIPGCINPYTWNSNGNAMPINNSFYMGGLVSKDYQFALSAGTDKKTYANTIYSSLSKFSAYTSLRETPVKCYGLKTAYPLDAPTDSEMRLDKLNDTAIQDLYYSFVITMDDTTVSDTRGFWDKVLFWKNDNTIKQNIDDRMRAIIITEDDMSALKQDLYVINSKNSYGSYDYAGAQNNHCYIFSSDGSVADNYLASPALRDNVNITEKVNSKDDVLTLNDIIKATSETKCIAGLNQVGIDLQIANTYQKEKIDKTQFTLADYANVLLKYYVITTIADIGTSLNLYSSQMGNLIVAQKTNLWAEIFYAYMMSYDSLNANLPSLDLTDISNIFSNIGGNATTTDQIAAENAKLANKLLKQMVTYTSNDYNTEKGDLVQNFATSIILKWHRQLLGLESTDIGNTGKSMKFTGINSPVELPSLQEMTITAYLLQMYKKVYVFLVAIALIVTIMLLLMRLRDFKQAVATILILAIGLLIPQTLLDSVTQVTNTVTTGMYTDRFTFWALLQHQQDIQNEKEQVALEEKEQEEGLNSAEESEKQLAKAMTAVERYYNASDGIQLKWMQAKKGNSYTGTTGVDMTEDAIPGLNTFKWLFSGYIKQESYASDALATYVYRTYSSIAQNAKSNYDNIKDMNGYIQQIDTVAMLSEERNGGKYTAQQHNFYKTVPLSNQEVTNAINNTNVGLQNAGLQIPATPNESMSAWLYLSESPFYYFYNALKDAYGEDDTFLEAFLSDDVYKSTTEDQTKGALKDYLDLEGLCTYVIPYMEGANNYVVRWVNKYGISANNYTGNLTDTNDKLDAITNNALNNVWNLYCPWVDTLEDLRITTATVSVMGHNYKVSDTFNPVMYYDEETQQGRYMVFSEAQRINDGVGVNDLTVTEQKLLQVLDETYTDIRYLANYVAYDNEALVTAAAMAATFNFNKIFSETALTGESKLLYPQGYELKTFNFDALMRLILLNNTGMSVMDTADVYETVVCSSLISGVLLVINDILTVDLIPAIKILMTVSIFVLTILVSITLVLQKSREILNVTTKILIQPTLLYGVLSVAYAGIIAVLMGDGLTTYVGSRSGTIVTNSPTQALLLLIIVDVVLIVSYWKIIAGMCKEIIKYGKMNLKQVTDVLRSGVPQLLKKITNSEALISLRQHYNANSANKARIARLNNQTSNVASQGVGTAQVQETQQTAETIQDTANKNAAYAEELNQLATDDTALDSASDKTVATDTTAQASDMHTSVVQETDAQDVNNAEQGDVQENTQLKGKKEIVVKTVKNADAVQENRVRINANKVENKTEDKQQENLGTAVTVEATKVQQLQMQENEKEAKTVIVENTPINDSDVQENRVRVNAKKPAKSKKSNKNTSDKDVK